MSKADVTDSRIKGDSLTIRYGSETVLRDFSFEIPPKQHTVFKGDSGSGKSTLLKALLHFVNPNAGRLDFGDSTSIRSLRKHSAWLPQDLNLGEGTVEEVMRVPFSFSANRTGSPEKSWIIETLNKLGLARTSLDKPYRNLSTGQRQRVGLALCHLLDKPVILLDEPTAALDQTSKQRASELLLDSPSDRTIISTSHDPDWLDTADKIIEID